MAVTAMPTETYALLGHNEISIADGTDAEAYLYGEIESLFSKEATLLQNTKETRFRLYILAASLRKRYLNSRTGRKAFNDWFGPKGRNLYRFFKTFPNFLKYAANGDLVNFVATKSKTPVEDLAKLPSSLRTLYQLHLAKEDLIEQKNEAIFWTLFESTPKRKSLTDKNIKYDQTPLIHDEHWDDETNEVEPATVAEDIKDWLDAWNNPTAPKKTNSEMNVPVATIYAHRSIFSFNRQGDHDGTVDLSDITKLIRDVSSAFGKTNNSQFRLETDIDVITKRYLKNKKQKHPARKILKKK